MQIRDISIVTPQKHSLAATVFSSSKEAFKTMVISSATGVPQGFYKKFAAYFADLGYVVLTFDYYGIGNSGSETDVLKTNAYNLRNWGKNDQAAALAFAKTNYPENEIILLTHSIGGQIVGFNPNYKYIDKIVMVASQSGYYRYFAGLHSPKMWLFWNLLIPVLTPLYGYFPSARIGLFANLPKNMAYEWARWGRKKNYMMHYYNPEEYFFDKIKAPIFSLSFAGDTYAPKKTVDWLTAQFKNGKISRYHYQEKGLQPLHFGYFKEKFKDLLWSKTHSWIVNN